MSVVEDPESQVGMQPGQTPGRGHNQCKGPEEASPWHTGSLKEASGWSRGSEGLAAERRSVPWESSEHRSHRICLNTTIWLPVSQGCRVGQ